MGRGKEDGVAGETWIFVLDARKIIWFGLTFKIDFVILIQANLSINHT